MVLHVDNYTDEIPPQETLTRANSEIVPARIHRAEKLALRRLAEERHTTASAMVRSLIRAELDRAEKGKRTA